MVLAAQPLAGLTRNHPDPNYPTTPFRFEHFRTTPVSLDHYVSQVHLRNFYSPALGGLMHAIRKSDLKRFRCNSESVCRIEEGSTNAYLKNNRAVEEFLLSVEPKYNSSVSKLRSGIIDPECIHAFAGFVAYVASCTPAAMRIHIAPLESQLQSTAAILDRQGLLPRASAILGSKTASELLADGTIHFEVDPKYPQAIGIDTMVARVSTYGNSHWEILVNDDQDNPFFTSDYPIALEEMRNRQIPNWIVPITPDLAIRIVPDIKLRGKPADLAFSSFTFLRRTLKRQETLGINRLIVQCAEDVIFYRNDQEWIADFVAKYRYHRVEVITQRVPAGTGFLNTGTQRIVSRHPGAQ